MKDSRFGWDDCLKRNVPKIDLRLVDTRIVVKKFAHILQNRTFERPQTWMAHVQRSDVVARLTENIRPIRAGLRSAVKGRFHFLAYLIRAANEAFRDDAGHLLLHDCLQRAGVFDRRHLGGTRDIVQ